MTNCNGCNNNKWFTSVIRFFGFCFAMLLWQNEGKCWYCYGSSETMWIAGGITICFKWFKGKFLYLYGGAQTRYWYIQFTQSAGIDCCCSTLFSGILFQQQQLIVSCTTSKEDTKPRWRTINKMNLSAIYISYTYYVTIFIQYYIKYSIIVEIFFT